MYKLDELNTKKVSDLQLIAKKLNIKKLDKLNKEELTYAILDYQAENTKPANEITKKKDQELVQRKIILQNLILKTLKKILK